MTFNRFCASWGVYQKPLYLTAYSDTLHAQLITGKIQRKFQSVTLRRDIFSEKEFGS